MVPTVEGFLRHVHTLASVIETQADMHASNRHVAYDLTLDYYDSCDKKCLAQNIEKAVLKMVSFWGFDRVAL